MLPSNSTNPDFRDTLAKAKPGLAFVVIIFGALIAFEIFNFTTTDHALRDLLGDLTFAGIPWATILALAFCGIDFAGIARLFTPEQGADEPKEVWYLFGAWLLAATMNAILTWWGVSMAVVSHSVESAAVVDPATLTGVVPVFVAVMVWVIRILIIGTLSLALDRLLHHNTQQQLVQNSYASQPSRPTRTHTTNVPGPTMNNIPSSLGSSASSRPAVSRAAAAANNYNARQARFSGAEEESDTSFDASPQNRGEPTYHSLSGRRGSQNSSGTGTSDTNPNPFRRS